MGYMISYEDPIGRIAYHYERDRSVAMDVAEFLMTEGNRLVRIQTGGNDELPLEISAVEARRSAKADMCRLYGKNLYESEEAWTRKYLGKKRN
jgi:hypothetical protein